LTVFETVFGRGTFFVGAGFTLIFSVHVPFRLPTIAPAFTEQTFVDREETAAVTAAFVGTDMPYVFAMVFVESFRPARNVGHFGLSFTFTVGAECVYPFATNRNHPFVRDMVVVAAFVAPLSDDTVTVDADVKSGAP
jgi:hypothetical protein